MGVTPGIPDLVIPEPIEPYHGLYVEMKAKGKKLSDEQKDFSEKLRARGYKVDMCDEFEKFQDVVKEYFSQKRKGLK